MSEGQMCQRGGWAHFACKKGLDSPSLRLTLTRHAIFIKKTGFKKQCLCVRGLDELALVIKKELDSSSLHLNLLRQVIFTKAQVREADGFLGGWAPLVAKKDWIHLVYI